MAGNSSRVSARQSVAAVGDGAPSGGGHRRSDRPAVSRFVQPGALASFRPVSVPDRRPDRRRLSQPGRLTPHSGGTGGAAGGGAVDVRKPQSLDRSPFARHRARSGRSRLPKPGGRTHLQRSLDGDQGISSALRRRAHGLPGRSPGRPGADGRYRCAGPTRRREANRSSTRARAFTSTTPRPRDRAGTSAWCSRPRKRSRYSPRER